MSILHHLDDALIDRVAQPMVDAASRYMGLSRYALAHLFLWGSFLIGFVDLKLHAGHLLVSKTSPAVLAPTFVLWTIIDYIFIVRYRRKDEGKTGVMPSARIERRRSRTVFILITAFNLMLSFASIAGTQPFSTANVLLMLYDVGADAVFLTALYLPACQAGPPRKPFNVMKRIASLFESRATAAGAA